MSTTGLEVFDDTLQKTNIWLQEIMEEMGPDRKRAYDVMRAVLHTLRDRLTVEEATHLGAQLPMLVRGIYFEGWHPAGKPTKDRSADEFLGHVSERLKMAPPLNAQDATRTVFRTVARHVTEGEIRHVRQSLPKDLQSFWQ